MIIIVLHSAYSGKPIYFNTSMLVCMSENDGGSKILSIAGGERIINVKETPRQIIDLIFAAEKAIGNEEET